MLTCKEITKAMASDELADAGWRRRLEARFHLLMCRHCRRYAAQLHRISKAAKALLGGQDEDPVTLNRLTRSILDPLP